MSNIKLTILCDDKLAPPLFAEHGFSVFIEKDDQSPILFDTGSSDVFMKNANILRKDLTKVEKIIISHGHYDHAGGLKHLSQIDKKFKVLVRQEIFTPKYNDEKFIGIDWKDLNQPIEFELIRDKITEISKGVYTFGPVQMKNDFEEPDPNFFIFKDGQKVRDFFDEELNLVIDDIDGIVLITGCAHRGVVNTVEEALKSFGKRIKTLVGGFHLYKASLSKIERVTDALKKLGVKQIIPCHCTGDQATEIFRNH